MSELQVFAVNADLDLRHTYLSRSAGETPTLPDLAGWLGLRQGGLNTDEIELFPLSDLADMPLSSYVATAFDILDAPLGQTATRLNALDGHVLLVPSAALAGDVTTGPDLTLIATLPMARPDHSPEALHPTPEPAPLDTTEPDMPDEKPNRTKSRISAILVALVLAIILFVWSNFM